MKLSMTIIENWIQKYHPVSTIISDKPTIAGVRLFSYNKNPSPDFLYIGRNRDFFEQSESDEILLVHRKDVISLKTQELEDVLDTVMDAFAFYQEWEQQMLSAFQKENPEQVIIDACKTVFGPMFYTNMSLQITAFSRQYPENSINENWGDFWRYGTLSVSSLSRMQGGQYMEKLLKKWDSEIFTEPKAGGEYQYSMMISQENSSGQLTGQLTIISKTPFKAYHKHLAIYIKRALCLVANHNINEDYGSIVQSLFRDFLSGKHNNHTSRSTFYQLQGWSPDQYFMIVLLHREQGTPITCSYDMKNLKNFFPNILYCDESALLETSSDIICCIPLKIFNTAGKNKPRRIESPEGFFQFADQLKLRYHASYAFAGIEHMAVQYRQAMLCRQMKCKTYYDCALTDLAGLKTGPDCRELAIHPALSCIQNYDLENHTAFYDILKTYLRCERSRGKTAELLYVHKNTLIYRLEKMISLFNLNLEDSYEREYLLLSIRCLDSMTDQRSTAFSQSDSLNPVST